VHKGGLKHYSFNFVNNNEKRIFDLALYLIIVVLWFWQLENNSKQSNNIKHYMVTDKP
jgi:hypothetical protein